ncbi:MAG: hypothetical protein IPH20_13460 [Bacteroidales bacterium]|nr:hypothetical protein [Bacteroidales bacterium]
MNILGEYYSDKTHIEYYKQTPEILKLSKYMNVFMQFTITLDKNGAIWDEFPNVSSFFKELLAQLFTWIHIRDYNTNLTQAFRELNSRQPLIYQTFKIFQHYDSYQAEDLYWIIRSNTLSNETCKALAQIESELNCKNILIKEAVFNGIRKTINRFREQPFLYFTEADIHASLSKDIMDGNSNLFIIGKQLENRSNVKVPVSLVHHEYPTNFRYESFKMRSSGYGDDEMHLTDINCLHGDRGNFDIVVLNQTFVEDLFSLHQGDLMDAMKHIINKDKKLTQKRITKEEIMFAIEVKFIHPFNAGNICMETEIKKDNNKLYVALRSSGHFIMPINLVFCNSDYIQSNQISVIENIKYYLKTQTHDGVCSIFIESYFSSNVKKTIKPIFIFKPGFQNNDWAEDLNRLLS